MVGKERKPLSDNVEIGETLIGGVKQGGKRGRGATKSIVIIAVEIKQPKGFGRVRMRYVPDASSKSILPFVNDVIATDSMILTDGWRGYNWLSDLGYAHIITRLSDSGNTAHVSKPGVHRVASLLKR